ncbi:wax ester synthase/diacylglycerol acyltransferase 5-like isoform X2 [Magnolia sinica]|uniref:wax ester synthase/diacylglycerol acyltransferase 5-like isoform X2 n=1 Tax=Magnolia sinica TaxID=86752 RepID=UPI002658B3CB|nr:wax ester synthase/diacylglycerol acyltransferase 5-like isoform X2 [Magnolia sinica]
MRKANMASNQSTDVVLEDHSRLLPASPTSEYIHSSILSLSIIGVFELEIPIEDSKATTLLRDLFLPINPRFSSTLVNDDKGAQRWKRVDVRLEDHVKVPHFPTGLPPATYDDYLQGYLSKIALDQLPENRPLWEIHIIKYPTSDAAGTVVFKLHHALGDGFSLMGALFSCLKRADDPSLPLTFPAYSAKTAASLRSHWMAVASKKLFNIAAGCWYTTPDFVQSVLHSTVLEDDWTAIRSGTPQVELEPVTISTVTFCLDRIRQIKSKIAGLYQQRMGRIWSSQRMTALVLLNTRMINGYHSVKEMLKKKTWGNHFTFLQIAIPSCSNAEKENPLAFLIKAKKTIKRKRHSLAVYLTGRLVQMLRTILGPETASRYIHSTLKNTTTAISSLVGPIEKAGMADHPVKSFYFTVAGAPQSLSLTMVSYMGKLWLAVAAEREFIDSQLLVYCLEEAYDKVHREACGKEGTQSK